MRDWTYRVDKVPTQTRAYKLGEAPKESVVNISTQKEQSPETPEAESLQKIAPEMFQYFGGARSVLVPTHSTWFSPGAVHEIERRALPSLTQTEEQREEYVRIRNRIFGMFQDNPSVPLGVSQCRKKIPADLSAIIRTHGFLEHWGLINYKIGEKRSISAMLEKVRHQELFGMDNNIHSVHNSSQQSRQTDQGIQQSTQQSNREEGSVSGRSAAYVMVGDSQLPTPGTQPSTQKPVFDFLRDASKHHTLQSNGPRLTEIPVPCVCSGCSREMNGVEGKEQIYFSDRSRLMLCSSCFAEGKYPPAYTYNSFYLLEAGVVRQVWSPEEEMLLLEGIEMYKDDWRAVAAYVKSKTVEQCVLHFLKMGIQDTLIEMESLSFSENKLPFNYTLNPVMATVAFLASVVHPGVASNAAKAAAEEIRRITQGSEKEEGKSRINERLNEIAAVALSSCAARAEQQKVLEEGKKERLLELLVESEMKRIEEKMAEYAELSNILKKEREDLKKMREAYRKAHLEARKEIAEVVSKARKICEETGKSFEEMFFKD